MVVGIDDEEPSNRAIVEKAHMMWSKICRCRMRLPLAIPLSWTFLK